VLSSPGQGTADSQIMADSRATADSPITADSLTRSCPDQPDCGTLRLMAVHAHPDDESSKGAATMARYVREGVEVADRR
jgi:hypothetical protein